MSQQHRKFIESLLIIQVLYLNSKCFQGDFNQYKIHCGTLMLSQVVQGILCYSRTHNQIINATLGSCAVDSDRVAQKPAEVLRQGFHDPSSTPSTPSDDGIG